MSDKKTPSRWYIVTNRDDGSACLVEAANAPQAYRRVAEHYCAARPASVGDVMTMMPTGCDVIRAPITPEQLEFDEVVPVPPAVAGKEGSGTGVPETPAPLKPPEALDTLRAEHARTPAVSRKASDVFGPGFTKGESDGE